MVTVCETCTTPFFESYDRPILSLSPGASDGLGLRAAVQPHEVCTFVTSSGVVPSLRISISVEHGSPHQILPKFHSDFATQSLAVAPLGAGVGWAVGICAAALPTIALSTVLNDR